jgi:hypothetical protein
MLVVPACVWVLIALARLVEGGTNANGTACTTNSDCVSGDCEDTGSIMAGTLFCCKNTMSTCHNNSDPSTGCMSCAGGSGSSAGTCQSICTTTGGCLNADTLCPALPGCNNMIASLNGSNGDCTWYGARPAVIRAPTFCRQVFRLRCCWHVQQWRRLCHRHGGWLHDQPGADIVVGVHVGGMLQHGGVRCWLDGDCGCHHKLLLCRRHQTRLRRRPAVSR